MSDAFHGADVAALRQQAVSLYGATEAIITCVQRTTAALDALAWRGQDAERRRDEWRTQHAPTVLRVAEALNGAALHLLEEAERQETASAATGTTGAAPAAPPGGGTWGQLKDKVAAGWGALTTVAGAVGDGQKVAISAAMVAADLRWDNVMSSTRTLNQATNIMTGAHIGPALGGAFTAATVVSTVDSAAKAATSYRSGDLYGAVDNGVTAVLNGASLSPALTVPAAALNASWDVGTDIGEAINRGMEGTAFGERFTQRMDASFDVAGAWGMVATPGALVVTAAEEVAIRAENAWHGLTGTGDGTLDTRR